MSVNLRDGIHRHADDDEHGRAPEVNRLTDHVEDDLRDHTDQSQINGTDYGDLHEHVVDVGGRLLARRTPGMKPPCFFKLSAVSVGLKTIAV